MFLCLTLTLAPLALPLAAILISLASAFGAPVYPVDIPAPLASDVAPVSAGIRVARYELRAYPLAECRAPHRAGVRGSVAVRYSGAPSYPSLDVAAF